MSLEEDLCRLVRRARKQLVLEALIEGRADLNNLLVVLEGLNIIWRQKKNYAVASGHNLRSVCHPSNS